MKPHLLALLLFACEPPTKPVIPSTQPDLMPATPGLCRDNGNRLTPTHGYWLDDVCAVKHCLPPEQIFAICTSKFGRIFSTRAGLQTTTAYGASWEVKTAGCPDYPWRVWQLDVFDVFDAGSWSAPSIQSDCSTEAKTQTGLLPLDRVYYTASEVPVSAVL